MDIGSAKPSLKEQKRVSHHGINLYPVDKPCDVGQYASYAQEKVREIQQRGNAVLVVGGSGFYLQSFFSPVVDQVEVPLQVREEVEFFYQENGLHALCDRLLALNPKGLDDLDRLNPRRVIRALERCIASGKSLEELKDAFQKLPKPYPQFNKKVVWLDRENSDLEERISRRTQKMLDSGLLEETREILNYGLSKNSPASASIGYREAIACLGGEIPEAELGSKINLSTRKLVSKQRKWFRKHLPAGSFITISQGKTLQLHDLLWITDT
jgi:tRNA dimethylallyltransferase